MGLRHRRRKLMLVTGASGFLGRHLTQGQASAGWELIAPSSTSMDIRRRDSTIDTITAWKPTAVVHLAYRKGERRTIVDGSRHVAEAATACGARLVHMSTDLVFPSRQRPYTEDDVPYPVESYGVDKYDAEQAVRDACPAAAIVRTSLLYGTDHLGVPQLDVERALHAAHRAAPMTFFTDEFRCPAHAADVAAAVAKIAASPEVTGPIHIAGPDAISRADFARQTARWLGLNPTMLRTGTIAESGLMRSAHVVLDTSRAQTLGLTCRSVEAVYRSR